MLAHGPGDEPHTRVAVDPIRVVSKDSTLLLWTLISRNERWLLCRQPTWRLMATAQVYRLQVAGAQLVPESNFL